MRDDLVAQVDDYLLPRLRQRRAGADRRRRLDRARKSTLVNSLVGSVVSPAGVLRPTTRSPVLACHPDDWPRSRATASCLVWRARPAGRVRRNAPARRRRALPQGLALLDSPDIDSVLAENRALANQLLAAADGWLFVTTAARYADAVPWEFLRSARERRTALSVVLNRVPADATAEVPAHLRQMLETEQLGDAEILVVPEVPLEGELLDATALWPVRAWLDGLAADAQARAALVRRTLRGALASLPVRALVVERAAMEQLAVAADLRAEAELAYAEALREVEAALRAARCFAARCWRAGTRSSAPAT